MATNSGEYGPLVFELNPADRIEFRYNEAQQPPVLVELKIKNPTDKSQLFKVKCTNNEMFKIRPPVGLIKAGEEVTVKLMLQWTDKAKIPENDTHYFSIYGREANEAPDQQQQSARQQWEKQQAHGRKRMLVRFEKTE